MKSKPRSKKTSAKAPFAGSRRRRVSGLPKKRFLRSTGPRVKQEEVEFVPGRLKQTEDGKRLYWHIFHLGKRAGHVSIEIYETSGARGDTSIDVQLNKQSQGRGIGTVAFRRACEMSGLSEVLASIRKGNIASRTAAERAGFVALQEEPSGELVMVWRRP